MKKLDVGTVLVTGEQRSGTTLLAKLLDAQPAVRVERDFAHVDRFVQRMGVQSIHTPLDRDQRRSLVLISTREILEGLGYTLAWDIDEFSTVADYYQGLLQRICRPEDNLLGHKSTRCYGCLEELLAMLPQLRVIFMMRDPRAVVPSEMRRARNNDRQGPISRWREGAERWWSLQDDQGLAGRAMMVRFEELVSDPSGALPGVAQFLGLKQIDHTLPLRERDRPWQANSSFNDDWEGISETPAERWRKGNPEVTQEVEAALAEPMQRMGYSLST